MSILNYFTKDKTPREIQAKALRLLEKHWDKADVFVLNLPVASGKSDIATTIARWNNSVNKKKSRILTPTNILVDQYIEDNPKLPVLKKKQSYSCINADLHSCAQIKGQLKKHCVGCPYVRDLRKVRVVPYSVSNYYIYLAHRLHSHTIILDEAHNVVDTLKDLAAKKIWRHEYHYPDTIKTYKDIVKWLESISVRDNKLEKLYREITQEEPSFIVQRSKEPFGKRMEIRDVLKLLPLETKNEPPRMWPDKQVKKIVLLSATMSKKDIENMGLNRKKVLFLEASSPIDAERRPVVISDIGNLSYRYQEKNLPKLRDFILETLDKHQEEKGIIHITYGLAYHLRKILDDPRLIWHTRDNREVKYQEFLNTGEARVLMASGMYEGINLSGDQGRFQIITKVPWPSLAEPAVAIKAKIDPEYYAWETIKVVLQGVGRVCRNPTDYGITYIADSTFTRLYRDNPDMFPKYFKESIKCGGA